MANPKHLAILNRGIEVWMKWRVLNRSRRPELREANLRGLDMNGVHLFGADLVKANLSEANLRAANLSVANLNEANLSKANLFGADLSRANLFEANLHETDLREADLRGADLNKADLSGANLFATHLNRVNLSRLNLCEINLSKANLSGANLHEADLSKANLSGTNLHEADLSKANFSGANLCGAKLIRTQALESNFSSANFTDACILDWNINSETNFADVHCDAIYLGWDYEKDEPTDRRPHDPDKTFAPGDFACLLEQSQETVDLLFRQGIDWSAFLNSFQNLQVSGEHGELTIQGINKKSDGSFVISVDAPLGTDKIAVEQDFWAKYQPILESKDRHIASLMGIVETMVEKQAEIAKTMADNQGNKFIKQEYSGTVYGVAGNVEGDQIINHNPDPSLTTFAAELQTLIAARTGQNTPTSTTQTMTVAAEIVQEIETKPDWKTKAISALKAGALEALKSHPIGAFVVSAIASWTA